MSVYFKVIFLVGPRKNYKSLKTKFKMKNETIIEINEFSKEDSQNVLKFLTNQYCINFFNGLIKTAFDEAFSLLKISNLSAYPSISLLAKFDNQIIAMSTFIIKTFKKNEKNEAICSISNMKISNSYENYSVERLFFEKMQEKFKLMDADINEIYYLVRPTERRTINILDSLGFKKVLTFICFSESNLQIRYRIQPLNMPQLFYFNFSQEKNKIENLMGESIFQYESLFSKSSYIGSYYKINKEETQFLGVNVWRASNEMRPHISTFIFPAKFYLYEYSNFLLCSFLLAAVFISYFLLKEMNLILMVLVIGVIFGSFLCFFKVREVLLLQRAFYLIISCPFYQNLEIDERNDLFIDLVADICELFKNELCTIKFIFEENEHFIDWGRLKIICGNIEKIQCLTYFFGQNKEYDGVKAEKYLDPIDFI